MRLRFGVTYVLCLTALVLCGAVGAPRSVTYTIRTMGTYANITVVTRDSLSSLTMVHAAQARFVWVDSLMSNWTPSSEVARVNREAAAHEITLHPEVAHVVEAALRFNQDSDGAFDITVEPLVRLWGFLGGPKRVPSESEVQRAFAHVGVKRLHFDSMTGQIRFEHDGVRIDLGGIAKGYAVDQVTTALRNAGVHDALVDLSGNMCALGAPATSQAWRIGIRDPRDRIAYFARLPLSERALATSGKYEQFVAQDGQTYGHILDPRTGRPAQGLISVTVLAPTAMEADGWSTSLFVLGPVAARAKAKSRSDIDAVLVQPGAAGVDTVWAEASLKGRFVLDDTAKGLFHLVWF